MVLTLRRSILEKARIKGGLRANHCFFNLGMYLQVIGAGVWDPGWQQGYELKTFAWLSEHRRGGHATFRFCSDTDSFEIKIELQQEGV